MQMTCEMFEARLAEYLEGELDPETRARMESHAASCAGCGGVLADLRRIAAEASKLPVLTPSRDLWDGITARIEAPVIPLAEGSEGRRPGRRGFSLPTRLAAAAAALIVVTASLTYLATRAIVGPDPATREIAAAVPATSPLGPLTEEPAVGPAIPAGEGPADEPLVGEPAETRRATPPARAPEPRAVNVSRPEIEQTYANEIDRLNAVLEERRDDLDPRTVAIVEENLKVIDAAIARARAALIADPRSTFLYDQLNRTLDTKVEVLRIAATLPAAS